MSYSSTADLFCSCHRDARNCVAHVASATLGVAVLWELATRALGGAAALALALAPAFALGAIGSALDGLIAELRRAKPDDYRALGGAEHAHAFYVARRAEYSFSLWCEGALTPARLCAVAGCGLMLLAVAAAIVP